MTGNGESFISNVLGLITGIRNKLRGTALIVNLSQLAAWLAEQFDSLMRQ